MLSDPRGIVVTAASADSVTRLEATIAAYCAFRKDTGDRLKEALAADPQLVMGHILRGYFMLLLVKRELIARAQQAAEAADAAMLAVGSTPREALHRQALGAWIRRDETRAIAIFEAILADYPRDIVALKLAQYLLFYSGDSQRMRDTVARAIASWDEAMPLHGFALGCHAFGLEECGDYDAAERAGRRATELNPTDIWGAHAVAHVFEMQERTAEGLAWIGALAPHWSTTNNFAFHVWWHRCLLLLKLRRHDEALARYDSEVRAESTDEHLDITNAVALLWRFEQAGIDVGKRWDELAQRAAARIEDHMTVFGDAHYAMALAAAGAPADVTRWQESAGIYAARAQETQAAVMREVGVALGEAAVAYRRGAFARVLDRLLPVRQAIRHIGGSHAQRDLFAQLVIDAAVKAGRRDVARDLLRERLAARPQNGWALDTMRLVEAER
jgi:tetratricopeptide (TPR) repeat protein